MIGLAYIIFFAVYLTISIAVVKIARAFAGENLKRKKIAGIIAGVFMYMLVFWDLIPVFVYHKYLCETQAGFWEYKTPEEWIKENPEMVGKDEHWGDWQYWYSKRVSDGDIKRSWLSSRIFNEHSYVRFTQAIRKKEDTLIDKKTGEVLFKSIEFERGSPSNIFARGGNVADYKIWLGIGKNFCGNSRISGYTDDYNSRLQKIIDLGKGK